MRINAMLYVYLHDHLSIQPAC